MQLKTGDLFSTEDYFDKQLRQYVTFSTVHETITRKATQANLSWMCNLGEVCEQFFSWKNAFPKLQPLFSLNSFNDAQFLDFVKQLGMGFICTDKKDLLKASESGLQDDSIFFINKTNIKSNLKAAAVYQNMIHYVHNERDVKSLYALTPSARIIVNIGDGSSMNVSKSILKLAKSREMNVIGLKCDLSDCKDVESIELLFERSIHILEYAESLNFKMQVFDIGESVMIDNANANKSDKDTQGGNKIGLIVDKLNSLLENSLFVKWSNMIVTCDVSNIIMNGERPSFSIVTTVQSVQHQLNQPHKNNHQLIHGHTGTDGAVHEKSFTCTVNDGIYGSFAGLLRSQVQLNSPTAWVIQDKESKEGKIGSGEASFAVHGAFTNDDPMDVVCGKCVLPDNLSMGDKIVFDHMGFLTNTTAINAFEFNGIQTPDIKLFIHHEKLDVAKKLQLKEFRVFAELECMSDEEMDTDIYEDNKIDEVQVLVESLALLDQNIVQESGTRFVVQPQQSRYTNNADANEQPIRIVDGDCVEIGGRRVRPLTFF